MDIKSCKKIGSKVCILLNLQVICSKWLLSDWRFVKALLNHLFGSFWLPIFYTHVLSIYSNNALISITWHFQFVAAYSLSIFSFSIFFIFYFAFIMSMSWNDKILMDNSLHVYSFQVTIIRCRVSTCWIAWLRCLRQSSWWNCYVTNCVNHFKSSIARLDLNPQCVKWLYMILHCIHNEDRIATDSINSHYHHCQPNKFIQLYTISILKY